MIDIYLITGFLGSGKTTLMKNLISMFRNSRVAMIVNEFGQEGVDGAVLEKEGMVIEEIVDGSIFCVCRSDKFIESILKTKDLNVDYLIVESSGLADSFGMPAVMDILNKVAPECFYYSRSICMIDAGNFSKVFEIAPAVEHQIQGADLIVINKIDVASVDEVLKIESKVRELNTFAEILKTSYSKILDPALVYSLKWNKPDMKGIIIKKTLGISKFIIKFESVSIDKLVGWLQSWTEEVYRVKGFCNYDNCRYYIQSVLNKVEVTELADGRNENFLVVLGPARDSIKDNAKRNWNEKFKTAIQII